MGTHTDEAGLHIVFAMGERCHPFVLCVDHRWVNWTANQSCFSPLWLFFHFATERGRCLRHVCSRLEPRIGAKHKEEYKTCFPFYFELFFPKEVCLYLLYV